VLTDKTVLITGGKRIGAVIAAELAAQGMDVALSYNRSKEEAEQTAAVVRKLGRRAFVLHADFSRAGDCATLVNESARQLGRLDVLINMASVYSAVPFAGASSTSPIGWPRAADLAMPATCRTTWQSAASSV